MTKMASTPCLEPWPGVWEARLGGDIGKAGFFSLWGLKASPQHLSEG